MKNIFKYISILLVLLLCACGTENNNVPYSIKDDYQTLIDINEKIGSSLLLPESWEVSDESFYVLDNKIAVYDFMMNEYACSLRASKVLDEDISGLLIDDEAAFNSFNNDYSLNTNNKNIKVGRFVINDTQYAFSMKYKSLDDKIFEDNINAIRQNIFDNELVDTIKNLEGIYYEESGTRAEATVKVLENSVIAIDIIVPKSELAYEEWIVFNSSFNGTKIKYGEYLHLLVEEKDEGEEVTDLEDSSSGYFEVIDEKLYWTGSNDENNSKCVFIKKVS